MSAGSVFGCKMKPSGHLLQRPHRCRLKGRNQVVDGDQRLRLAGQYPFTPDAVDSGRHELCPVLLLRRGSAIPGHRSGVETLHILLENLLKNGFKAPFNG